MSVQVVKGTCPACGAHFQFAPGSPNTTCEYCGSGLTFIRTVASYHPGCADEQNRLSLARMALQNKNAEAIKYSTEVLEINPDNAEAWMIKGTATAYAATGQDGELRYQEAMYCLDRAKELDPALAEIEVRREEVRELICNLFFVIGAGLWKRAVEIGNIYVKAGMGGYSKTGELPEKAIQYYERALAIDPMYRVTLMGVIFIRKETGRIELASSHIQRMKKLDPSYEPPRNRSQAAENIASFNQGLNSVIYIVFSLLSLILLFAAMSKSC